MAAKKIYRHPASLSTMNIMPEDTGKMVAMRKNVDDGITDYFDKLDDSITTSAGISLIS